MRTMNTCELQSGSVREGNVYCAAVLEVVFSKEKGLPDLLHETVAGGRVNVLVPLLF